MAVAARRLSDAAVLPAPGREPARRTRHAPEREAPAPRTRARRAARPRIGRPLMWVGVIGTLLAGIVALNVAVLQLRIERGNVSSDIQKIRAENDGLHAELSRVRSSGRVEAKARSGLGLVDAPDRVFLKLLPPR